MCQDGTVLTYLLDLAHPCKLKDPEDLELAHRLLGAYIRGRSPEPLPRTI